MDGLSFVGSKVAHTLPYVRKDGIRYGCTNNWRTQSDSYAFLADGNLRVPVEISSLFVIQVPLSGKSPHVCAIVRRMRSDDGIPVMPWDL